MLADAAPIHADNWPQAVVYISLLVIACLNNYHTRKYGKHAKNTDEAVNQTAPGEPRLYKLAFEGKELALENKESSLENNKKLQEVKGELDEVVAWKEGYDGGPLDKGDKVVDFVKEYKKDREEIKKSLEEIKKIALTPCGDVDCPAIKRKLAAKAGA